MLNNYNIKIIKEFRIGECDIPFIFSLDKIKAFSEQRPMYIGEDDKYSANIVLDNIKDKIFENFYSCGFDLTLDEDIDMEWLSNFKLNIDYKIEKDKVYIISKELFFEIIHEIEGFNQYKINEILNFIYTNEHKLMKCFQTNLLEDLEYFLDNKTIGNDMTHFLQWACGETSINPNPFFPENLGKATIDWSWREIELRNIFKSKMFKVEQAIEALKAKIMEEIKNNKNTRR